MHVLLIVFSLASGYCEKNDV